MYITNYMEVVENPLKRKNYEHSLQKPMDTQQLIELQDMEGSTITQAEKGKIVNSWSIIYIDNLVNFGNGIDLNGNNS
jgi:hypothetical protein